MTSTLKNTKSVIAKELRSYLDSPTAYIAAVVFLLLWEFLFFRDVFLVGEASLRGMFSVLPWMFLLLIPAITMGSVAQEKSDGTLEFLLTHPLRDREFVLGKFLAPTIFAALALAFIVPLAASLARFGDIDWGVIAGQYMGALFLAATFVALGVFVSTLFRSQVSALLVSAAAGFALIVLGLDLVTSRMPLRTAAVFEQLGVLSHFESMSRGVIDLRDVWYFLSAITVFLALAYLQLRRRRFGNRKGRYRSLQAGVALFIGIAIVTNVIGSQIPGRIDLTEGGLYTLTDATRDRLTALEDVVTIDLYRSAELPSRLQPTLRDVEDLLRDYDTVGGGDVVVKKADPKADDEIAEKARAAGVQEVQFNVVGNEEFELRNGYLGIAVTYAGTTESIPFVQDAGNLEYELTSLITKLTIDEKPEVGFATGFGMKEYTTDYASLVEEMQKQFEVTAVPLAEDKVEIPKGLAALVVAGPSEKIPDRAREALKDYLDGGGAAMFLLDGVAIDLNTLEVTPNENSFSDFIESYGVSVNQDLVYDLESNITAQFSAGGMPFLSQYPFWARMRADASHPITAGVEGAVMRWTSSISLDDTALEKQGLSATSLLKTTDSGGTQAGSFNIAPNTPPASEGLGEKIGAVSVAGAADEDEGSDKSPRMVVFGDSEFLTEQFLQQAPETAILGLEAISWLTQEASLASIQARSTATRTLDMKDGDQAFVKWSNMLLVAFVPLLIGGWRFLRRRKLRQKQYPRKPGRTPKSAPKSTNRTPVGAGRS